MKGRHGELFMRSKESALLKEPPPFLQKVLLFTRYKIMIRTPFLQICYSLSGLDRKNLTRPPPNFLYIVIHSTVLKLSPRKKLLRKFSDVIKIGLWDMSRADAQINRKQKTSEDAESWAARRDNKKDRNLFQRVFCGKE